METQYYLFGASGHGKVVADILISSKIAIATILDDDPAQNKILGIAVIPRAAYVPTANDQLIITIGNNAVRKRVVEKNTFSYFTAIAPSASISPFAEIGAGSVVMPQAVINAGVKTGEHCIINSGSVVEHDCVLGNYVHISPKAALAGHVTIGEGTQIGLGATVIQGLHIGKWATIGAGAVVIKEVPDYAVVVGNPGRIIKFNDPD